MIIKQKNITATFLLFAFFLVLTTSVHSSEDDFDFFGMDDLDLDIDLMEQENAFDSRAPINSNTANGLGIFFQLINLNNPIWTSTRGEKGRDVLYLMPSKITAIEYGGGSCNLFFNMTPKMHLTGGSLLSFDQINADSLGVALAHQPPFQGMQNSNQVGVLLPFIKRITVQERKAGTYFQTGFVHKAFIVQFHSSLQVAERNFWINRRDLDELRIVNKLIFGENQQYDESNLYKINAGMGDTRVKMGVNALNTKNFQTDIGLECIIPTSRASQKSLRETNIDNELTDDEAVFQIAVDGLMNIRDYLLTPVLGNGGHSGLGFYLEGKANIFSNLAELITRVSVDKFFEAEEQRIMLHKKKTQIDDLLNTPNDATAQKNVINFVKEYLLPLPYTVNVEPGAIFNAVALLHIPYKKWDFRYGYDFYFQQAERFNYIQTNPDTLQLLNTDLARVGTVIQHKISSETTYRIKNFNNINLDIGFGGDTTISAHNIGKDWTLYFKFASEF